MKKLALFSFLFFAAISLQAQLKIGGFVGAPLGETSDYFKITVGADVYYMFGNNPDAFVKFGGATGFIDYIGDDRELDYGIEPLYKNIPMGSGSKYDDAQFIPVAAAARINILGTLTAGADLGYAIGLSDYDGGFYGKAIVGIDIFNRLELNAFYHGIVLDETTLGTLGAGLLFEF